MKVELGSSHRKALVKGCLWMGENDGSSKGVEHEGEQQPRLPHQWHPIAKTYGEKVLSRFYYL